jgi:hypothetical protein
MLTGHGETRQETGHPNLPEVRSQPHRETDAGARLCRGQMIEPSVCAVMLTRDRPEMARRAIDCFRKQTYTAKKLLIWDSGPSEALSGEDDVEDAGYGSTLWAPNMSREGATIGELRNDAIRFCKDFQIVVHWDDDDWSHPNRIAEQVELLQDSKADCVGYREMLFWRQEERQAWLYSSLDPRYCLGTSLCYWRSAWERRPFEATSQGEDARFTAGLYCSGDVIFDADDPEEGILPISPRMIARIHPGNTSNAYAPAKMAEWAEWSRAPGWDAYCAENMA